VEFRDDLNISVWNPQSDTALYKRVRPGDFVIGLRSFQSGIGHSKIEGLVSPAYTVLRPTHPDVQQAFFRHYFKSDIFISQLDNVAQGIRQGRTIGTEDFYGLSLPLPSPEEQRAIADFLDRETARIDALIAKKREMIQLADMRFRGFRMRTLRLVKSQRSASPTRLKFLTEPPTGGIWGEEPGSKAADVVCYRAGDLDRFRATTLRQSAPVRSISLDEVRRFHLQDGDLVLEKSGGGDKAPVGFVASYLPTQEAAVCSNFMARLRPRPDVDSRFLVHLFGALYDEGRVRGFIKQTTGIQNLEAGAFLGTGCHVPRAVEQLATARRLEEELQRCESLSQTVLLQVTRLQEHRQALITAAVTGRVGASSVA